jgi:hypothetical protein
MLSIARAVAVLTCAFLTSVPAIVAAQSAPPQAAMAGAAAAAVAAAAAAKPADYDTFVKGAEKQDGLFTVWRKEGKVYLEVRDDQLDSDFLEHVLPVNGLGGYGFHGGDQLTQDARLVRFHLTGKSVAVVWPHTRFQATPGTPQATAIRESTADSVQAMMPVAADNRAGKSRVLDASALLGDTLDLANSMNDAVGAERSPGGAYHLDPSRTYFGTTKAFPENVIVEADETFASSKPDAIDTVPDPHSVQIKVRYAFSQIMSTPGYMPRLSDDRVGFWSQGHTSFDRDFERDPNRFYILRWDVEPSDPTQKLSPAKKPIVFYLDRSIPMEYRGAVRDGVLEWNKAFEQIAGRSELGSRRHSQ